MRARGATLGPDLTRLYAHLTPSDRMQKMYIAPCMEKIRQKFVGEGEPYLAVHARVEDDWVKTFCSDYNTTKLDVMHSQGCFGADEIADVVSKTP
eukprot:scaffold5320_cov50-Prasinocladus_malaysianus.AAC.1